MGMPLCTGVDYPLSDQILFRYLYTSKFNEKSACRVRPARIDK